jgi:hypothetical protein
MHKNYHLINFLFARGIPHFITLHYITPHCIILSDINGILYVSTKFIMYTNLNKLNSVRTFREIN